MIGSGVGSRTGSGEGILTGGGVGSLGGSGVGSFGGSGVGTFGGSGVGTLSFLTTLESTFNIWLGIESESRRLALDRGRCVILGQDKLLRFRGADHINGRIVTHSKRSPVTYITKSTRQ